MNIQAQFNNQAILKLTRLNDVIKQASQHNASQIKAIALREIMNSKICLDDMNKNQLNEFEVTLLNQLKFKQLIK